MTVSEYIFEFLAEHGTDVVFMVSGSSAMWLTDALCRNKDVEAVCNHHEQASVMAADLYARLHEKMGAALVTVGPGAMNAVTGVAQAYVDSSAVFVVSGQVNSRLLSYEQKTGIRQHGTQSVDLASMIPPITKYFAVVTQPADIRYHMERAYYEALHGRKGPVWLDVPIDIQNQQIPQEMRGFAPESCHYDVIDAGAIGELLAHAQKPLILAGGGASRQAITEFADAFGIPVVTSRMGIECIGSDSPYFVGRPGANGQRAAHFAIQQADLLFILGCRLAVSTVGYYPDRFGKNAIKVQVDIDAKELAKTDVPVDYKYHASVQAFVDTVKHCSAPSYSPWLKHCQDMREKYPVVLAEYRACDPLNSYYFTEQLSKAAPEDAVVVVDTGSVSNVVSQTWDIKASQRYFISGGLSCMGFWAGAIGCAAASRRPVIAVAGDGSASMNVQEFATLAYYKFPLKLFVYQNEGYMLIRHNQHNYMDDRFLGVGPDSGVKTPDFCKVAQAYGLQSVRIQHGDNIAAKLQEVFAADGPVVCEVMLEPFGPMAPRIASRVMPDGSLKAAEYDDMAPFLDEKECTE